MKSYSRNLSSDPYTASRQIVWVRDPWAYCHIPGISTLQFEISRKFFHLQPTFHLRIKFHMLLIIHKPFFRLSCVLLELSFTLFSISGFEFAVVRDLKGTERDHIDLRIRNEDNIVSVFFFASMKYMHKH